MLKIFKYTVPIVDEFELRLPEGAKILSFQTQSLMPVVWALVDDAAETVTRHFRLFGTGNPIESVAGCRHIGTTQQGPYVWHLFEKLGEHS